MDVSIAVVAIMLGAATLVIAVVAFVGLFRKKEGHVTFPFLGFDVDPKGAFGLLVAGFGLLASGASGIASLNAQAETDRTLGELLDRMANSNSQHEHAQLEASLHSIIDMLDRIQIAVVEESQRRPVELPDPPAPHVDEPLRKFAKELDRRDIEVIRRIRPSIADDIERLRNINVP